VEKLPQLVRDASAAAAASGAGDPVSQDALTEVSTLPSACVCQELAWSL